MFREDHYADDDTGPVRPVGGGHVERGGHRETRATVTGELPLAALRDMTGRAEPVPPHTQTAYQQPYAPEQRPARPRWFGPALKVVGLVLVAVVSGLIYWAVDSGSTPTEQAAAHPHPGGFDFQQAHVPVLDSDCAAQSYGEAKKFFRHDRCSQLRRVLYSATATGGAKVLSSVSTVTMPSAEQAIQLKRLTDSDGTGNVSDLPTSGIRVSGGPASLKGSGYASLRHGNTVVIAESGFFDGHQDEAYLKKVSRAALQAG